MSVLRLGDRDMNTNRLILIIASLALSACDAVNDAIDEIEDIGNNADVYYYVSLGDSLSVGVQPNGAGVVLPTDDGYADQLFDLIKRDFEAGGANRELRLRKLGCPGETLNSLENGGDCIYLAGSQLDAAVDFLQDEGDKVYLVTIDIGGNDFRDADCITDPNIFDCVDAVNNQIETDLAMVLAKLNAAADPDTTIVGMNYYNPYLAAWLEDAAGQALAVQSADAVSMFNDSLATTFDTAGVPMADVYAAFDSSDFVTMVPTSFPPPNDMLPLNVSNICTFTYMCDPDPVGPDIHATNAGYALIAETLANTIP